MKIHNESRKDSKCSFSNVHVTNLTTYFYANIYNVIKFFNFSAKKLQRNFIMSEITIRLFERRDQDAAWQVWYQNGAGIIKEYWREHKFNQNLTKALVLGFLGYHFLHPIFFALPLIALALYAHFYG